MQLFIHTGNFGNTSAVGDRVRFLKCALRDCGHTARLSPRVEPGRLNILLENFVQEQHLRQLLEAHRQGARYILVASQPIEGDSFRGPVDPAATAAAAADYWKLRFDSFALVARLADAIWVSSAGLMADYAARFPALPVRHLPWGHASGFATVQRRPEAERDIDFYFSGTLTGHRRRLLEALATTHKVVCGSWDLPEYLRQDQVSRAKVCLAPRYAADDALPSSARLHYHLHNGSFVLHEFHARPDALDDFVIRADDADFVAWARAALRLPDRRQIAEQAHERFRSALPMRRLLPPLLDEVLGRHSPVVSGATHAHHLPHRQPSQLAVDR